MGNIKISDKMMTLPQKNNSIQKQLRISQAALRIAQLLNKSERLDSVTENLMGEFIDLVGADAGSIQLLRPFSQTTRRTLFRREAKDRKLLDKRLDNFLVGYVLEQKQAMLSHDLSSLFELESFASCYREVTSIIAVPINLDERIIGVVTLIRKKGSIVFTPSEQQMVSDLAGQIAPFIEAAELRQKLFSEKERLQKNLEERYSFHGIIGSSASFKVVYDLLEQIIPTDARVVILGESGTGKELIAKCIHYAGPRKDNPFMAVDCGALPNNLLESELFGYVRGAFTGAINDRLGLIEEADTGTLFLDEFTNMNMETQAKLLRVVQEGEIRPIGANQTKKVDVRIIVAASDDLTKKVSDGKIRSDLYYRLNVVTIPVPPLRERVEDIPALSSLFLSRYAKRHTKKVKTISPEALQIFEKYAWPGNIRELENVIERGVVLMRGGETVLLPKHLPRELTSSETIKPFLEIPSQGNLAAIMDDYERKLLENVLRQHNWNRTAAARALRIPASVIRYKIKRLGIVPPS